MNLEASLHSLLSFAWTLTRPTNFNLLRQNIVFSYSERIPVSFSWLFHYFSFFFCYFTLLLIFTKIILLLLLFFSWKLFLFFHFPGCSGMFRVPGFIDAHVCAPLRDTNMAAGNQQKHLFLSFKVMFILRQGMFG